jgi:hypothetical protein
MTLMQLSDLSTDERSLLLFFETAAVEHGGLFQGSKISVGDMAIARRWSEAGFINFGMITACDIPLSGYQHTHWIYLSGEAWDLAHEARRARNKR